MTAVSDNTDRIMSDIYNQMVALERIERDKAENTPTIELPFLMNDGWFCQEHEKTYHMRLASAYREVFGTDPESRNQNG